MTSRLDSIVAVRPKRVLVIVHSYYLRDTRPRRHAVALAAAGWQVDVLCARAEGEPAREEVDEVSLYRLPAKRRRGSWLRYIFEYVSFTALAMVAASVLHLRRRYRAVYVVGIPNFLVLSALVPKATGARVVLDMRDPLPEFFAAKYGFADRSLAMRALLLEEKISARFADVVLAPHARCARDYERSVSRDRIVIVMNAPDPKLFSGDQLNRDASDRTMLYAGTVASRYGVDLAIRALARLRDDIPGLSLRIVGDGDQLSDLRTLAQELGVEGDVHFDGPVSLDKVPAIVRSTWLGVQPNRDDPLMRLNLSTKVLEWARLGLPVVVGMTPPLADYFTDEELLVCRPGDFDELCARIREAAADPEALAKRAARARAASDNVRYEVQIATLIHAIEG